MRDQQAFSLVEVLVGAVLMTVSATAIFAAVGSVTSRSPGKPKEFVALSVGQRLLNNLSSLVNHMDWNDGSSPLAITGSAVTGNFAEYSTYNYSYIVTADVAGSRKVTLSVDVPLYD